VELTTTQVSLIAALIALAAPAITYRASARLDRDRWVRERRAETYIDARAVLGRIAAHVTEPETRPDPFGAVPGVQWRRVEGVGPQAHRVTARRRQFGCRPGGRLLCWRQRRPTRTHQETEMPPAFMSARTGFAPACEDRTLRGHREPRDPGPCRRR